MSDFLQSDYYQPSFYHFSRDSISLAKFIKHSVSLNNKKNLLELGAGCGVISCEILKKESINQLVLVEKQIEFKNLIIKNTKDFNFPISIINNDFNSYDDLMENEFDLIYFNPPYFFEEETRPSPNPKKDICRRIKKEEFKNWILKAVSLLKPNGDLFFCHRLGSLKDVLALEVSFEVTKEEEGDGCFLYRYSTRL